MSPMLQLSSAVLTHPGRKRHHNEDFVAYYEPETYDEWVVNGAIYIVADGVGGEAKGERASQYAVQDVLYRYDNDPDPDLGARLGRAMRAAGNAIYDYAQRTGLGARMATTMVAAVVHGERVTIANVGDSRAYLIRGGQATQLTTDHTIAGEMLRHGEITEEEAQHFKGKNRITRSIGGERDVRVDIFPDIPLQPGDKLLLCSDGLARYTLGPDIVHLTAEGTPQDIVNRCITYANQRGGTDNISAALVEMGEPATPGVVPSKGGATPTAVEWEEIATAPSMDPPAGRKFQPTFFHWAMLGGAFLVALAAIIIFLPRLLPREDVDVDTAAAETIAAMETVTSLPAAEENEEQATIEPTVEPTPVPATLTPEPTVSSSPAPAMDGECIYTVQEGVSLWSVLMNAGYPPEDYYESIIDIVREIPIPDPSETEPGQQLRFEFINNEADCDLIGGEWQSLPSSENKLNE